MKIRIIKASNPECWYFDKIGQVFELEAKGFIKVWVKHEDPADSINNVAGYAVYKDDYEIVKDYNFLRKPKCVFCSLYELTDAERLEIFEEIRSKFCVDCGSIDRFCQCSNDD